MDYPGRFRNYSSSFILPGDRRQENQNWRWKLVGLLVTGFSPGRFISGIFWSFTGDGCRYHRRTQPRQDWWGRNIKRKGIDIAIAMDVSKSMLATDLAPSRLERAKQFVNKLMDEMPDDRISLILFAGKAYMQMPLTTDHGAAKLLFLLPGRCGAAAGNGYQWCIGKCKGF